MHVYKGPGTAIVLQRSTLWFVPSVLLMCIIYVFCMTANKTSSSNWLDLHGVLFADENQPVCNRRVRPHMLLTFFKDASIK